MGVVPFRHRRKLPYWPVIVGAVVTAAVAFVAVYAFLGWRDQPKIPTVIPPTFQAPQRIEVVDGDTVRVGGYAYRLVGFDTPEKGYLARCDDERRRADLASRRLQDLVASGGAKLERVPCACKPGQEETRLCNYGRRCGLLTVGGRNVGQILISEGLAHPYVCGLTICPPRQTWCGERR